MERQDIHVRIGYMYGSVCHQLAVPISGDPGRVFSRFDMGEVQLFFYKAYYGGL